MATKFMSKINPKNTACPICGNKKSGHLFDSEDYITSELFGIYECSQCVVFTEIKKDIDLSAYYSDVYYGSRKSGVERLINLARIRAVSKFKNFEQPSLLDIGCGNGSFVERARQNGWESFGTEIAPPNHLKSSGHVYRGDFLDVNFSENSFDLVSLWHSFEHIKDPRKYLSKVRKILKTGGTLLIELPNFASWQAKMFRGNWFHLDVPRHLYHFSPDSLSLLIQKEDFRDIKVQRGSLIYDLFGYLQSSLNLFSKRKNLLFDFLNKKIHFSKLCENHKRDLLTNLIFIGPLGILSCLVFIVELLFKRISGTILVFAKK